MVSDKVPLESVISLQTYLRRCSGIERVVNLLTKEEAINCIIYHSISNNTKKEINVLQYRDVFIHRLLLIALKLLNISMMSCFTIYNAAPG